MKIERPIAITCGDPAGVGPELIETWLTAAQISKKDYTIIGPRAWVMDLHLRFQVPVRPVGSNDFVICPGQPSGASAQVAYNALQEAAEGCLKGIYSAVVTGPVHKKHLAEIGYQYPGQTEFFAARWGGAPTMIFVTPKSVVSLVTGHIPLLQVPQHLTKEKLHRTIQHTIELCRRRGVANPRIAICGLNPHAGEGGILGVEEVTFINPTLEQLNFPGAQVSKCLPADTVFWQQLQGGFDATVALYHDQGLIAVKTLAFDHAVNLTWGLPFIRTSPDHGTAYDIVGQGKADPRSFIAAIELARELVVSKNTLYQ